MSWLKLYVCKILHEEFVCRKIYTLPELDWQKYLRVKAYENVLKASVLGDVVKQRLNVSRSRMSRYLWAIVCSY